MEKIDLRVQSSMAKFVGTIVCIAGALTVTLYKGLPLTNVLPSMRQELLLQPHSSWIIGGFLLACAAFLLSVLLVVQVCRSKCVNYSIICVINYMDMIRSKYTNITKITLTLRCSIVNDVDKNWFQHFWWDQSSLQSQDTKTLEHRPSTRTVYNAPSRWAFQHTQRVLQSPSISLNHWAYSD